ncbi:MAG: FtsX-like permease family protein [Pseudomonadota bacterium]
MLEILKQEQIVPFNTTTAYRFVPWIIALMVFLAILALSGAASVNVMVQTWQQNHKEVTYITLKESHLSGLSLKAQRDRVFEILKDLQVVRVTVHSKENLLPGRALQETPIQALRFEVQPHPGQYLNVERLSHRLEAEHLGARVNSSGQEREVMLQIARSVLWISTLLSTLIGIAAIVTVAFVTHSGLEAHQRVINILNIVGARNHFIAQQFQRHALVLSCKGGIIGAGFALLVLGVISACMPDANLLGITLSWPFGMIASIMVLTPMGVMLLASFSAHLTVLSALMNPRAKSRVHTKSLH